VCVCVGAQVRQIWFGLGFGCCLSCRPWGSRVESDRSKTKLNSAENGASPKSGNF